MRGAGAPGKVAKALGLSEAAVRMKLSVLELLLNVKKEVRIKYAPPDGRGVDSFRP